MKYLFQRIPQVLEGELSPLNKSLFQSQESLSPTQPATILILQGVIAYVDVRCGAENRSQAFKEVLKSLGAIVCDKFTAEVTHVIFREGSKLITN
ncbi:hypothetical protein Anas_08361 [Armadillidium nasatum]|uniref:BRCT domain-containing protein n=1 Tax=Armadillidium nasatum TaxID=96803 RepID=A0A5N5TCM4_9CRUS|nr:hypothetical protein Anas_08361 [Armadillidium nasatum]